GGVYFGGDYANEMDKLPGYTVTDLMLRYTPGRLDGLDLFVAVNNVLNEKYSSVGYVGYPPPDYLREQVYYPSPERNFRVGMSYRF
ncbi:MAG: hypothetical protein WCP86_07830, partial [bacterium]